MVAWRIEDGVFSLLDVAARSLPSLSSIVGGLGIEATRIDVFFPPDRLDWNGAPRLYHGPCRLMIRGDVPSLTRPPHFMLSPMADF